MKVSPCKGVVLPSFLMFKGENVLCASKKNLLKHQGILRRSASWNFAYVTANINFTLRIPYSQQSTEDRIVTI
jgi:hypothetical protein